MAIFALLGVGTAVVAPNFGGGSTTKRPNLGNRSGRYVLNGYTLELHYDNGVVSSRIPN
jgi:hypothetical protein